MHFTTTIFLALAIASSVFALPFDSQKHLPDIIASQAANRRARDEGTSQVGGPCSAEGREVCLNNSTTIGSCQSGIWVESEDVKASGECTVSGVQCFSVPKITRPGAENLCVNLGELEELLKFLKVPGGVFGDEDGSEPGGSQSTTATSDEPTSTGEGTANQTPTATPSGTECTPASTTLSIPTPAPPSSTSSSSQTSATTTTTGADGKATVVISGPIETPVPADPASIPVATVTVTTTVGAPQTAAPTPA